MSNADLTARTPAEIDAVLAELTHARAVAADRAVQYAQMAKDSITYPERYQAMAEEQAAKATELAAQIAPLNAEFTRRGGWTRAFLVQASNGHVHSSMNCGTCFPTTQYAWMTAFSGQTEDEIVDAAGERACTVCYPSAPVEVLAQPTRMFTPDEIAKQAARAEREAKKVAAEAAAIRHCLSGKVVFKTERAARNEISRLLDASLLYESDEDLNEAGANILHLAHSLGADVNALRDELVAKAEKKFRREAIKNIKGALAGKGLGGQFAQDPANWHASYRTIATEEGLI